MTSPWISRSFRATAMSRWMWPSPTGLDSQRIRRAAVRRERGAGAWRSVVGGIVWDSTGRSSTKSRISRFTFAMSRPWRLCPPPSKVTRRAPGIAWTIFSAWVYGTIRSSVPWSASVGTRIWASSA